MWLIVDDGSTDDTRAVVDGYIAEGKIAIAYHYQHNQGKHMATNHAVKMTDSDLLWTVVYLIRAYAKMSREDTEGSISGQRIPA